MPQSDGATITKIVIISNCRTEIAMTLRFSHLFSTGFVSAPDSVRLSKRRETINVVPAANGVNPHAINPAGRKPSNSKIIIAKAARFEIIANKATIGTRRCQFSADVILKTKKVGSGPDRSGGRNTLVRKNNICMEVTSLIIF